jgi:superfamily II RNA helicase
MSEGIIADAARDAQDMLQAAFLLRAGVLQTFGYLDAAARLTAAGRWAMRLRHPRLLILAELVRRRQLPATGARLAAAAAALGTERPPRAGGTTARLGALARIVDDITAVERRLGVEPDPLSAEFRGGWDRGRRRPIPSPAERRAGAAEAWARGAKWLYLVRETDSEEGDLQRTILQAAEILMQIEGLPMPALRVMARQTRELLLRAPIV